MEDIRTSFRFHPHSLFLSFKKFALLYHVFFNRGSCNRSIIEQRNVRVKEGGAGREKSHPQNISSSPKGGQEDGIGEGAYRGRQVSACSRPATIQSFNEQPLPQWWDE